jgi:hypothetical protein
VVEARGPRANVVWLGAIGVLAAGLCQTNCSPSNPMGCSEDCPDFPATLSMSCAPNDLSNVQVTGPCVGGVVALDGGVTDYSVGQGGEYVSINSLGDGACHVVLTFGAGFVFATDVQFTVQGESCGCAFIMPTTAKVAVNNPPNTCSGDAGDDAHGG